MDVVAWSANLTAETAAARGARLVGKHELFEVSDVVSIHLLLSGRTRGLVGAGELRAMKPDAWLVNTSRGPIVDESALLQACARTGSRARRSTSSTPNRFPPTTSCAACRPRSSPRTPATSRARTTATGTPPPSTSSPPTPPAPRSAW